MVLITEMGSVIGEEEHAAPTIEPMALPLEAVIQDSLEEVPTSGVPMETVPKMSIEGHSEKDLIEEVRMEEAVDNSKKDLTTKMETGGSLEMATPVGHFLASTAHVGPSNSMLRAPSIGEILQSVVKYLRNLLPPVEWLFLNKQREEK